MALSLANSFVLYDTVCIKNMDKITILVNYTLLFVPEHRPVSVCFYLFALKHVG